LDGEPWERWVPADGKGLEVSNRWALLAAARVTLVHFADARHIHCICGTASIQVADRRGRPPALCSAVNHNTLSCLKSICWHATCYLILIISAKNDARSQTLVLLLVCCDFSGSSQAHVIQMTAHRL